VSTMGSIGLVGADGVSVVLITICSRRLDVRISGRIAKLQGVIGLRSSSQPA
jgi:hypothetical protein